MRRRVTIHVPATVQITGLVEMPDPEPGQDVTDQQVVEAAVETGQLLITSYADRQVMSGAWPEVLNGASVEVRFADDAEVQLTEVHPA